MLVRREHGDDSLDRLWRVGAVHRGKHLVPGVGGAQSRAEGLDVAQFAHKNHVRILAERLAERLVER